VADQPPLIAAHDGVLVGHASAGASALMPIPLDCACTWLPVSCVRMMLVTWWPTGFQLAQRARRRYAGS